jgi:hypothetical protein
MGMTGGRYDPVPAIVTQHLREVLLGFVQGVEIAGVRLAARPRVGDLVLERFVLADAHDHHARHHRMPIGAVSHLADDGVLLDLGDIAPVGHHDHRPRHPV